MSQPTATGSDSYEPLSESETLLSESDSNAAEIETDTVDLSDAQVGSGEYDRLRQRLLVTTLVSSAVIAVLIALFYPPNVAANYAIGCVGGLAYLRMLGRGVARLGPANGNTGGPARLALFAGLIIVASRVNSLEVLPVFFGFMTYKVALFVYAIQTLVPSRTSKAP